MNPLPNVGKKQRKSRVYSLSLTNIKLCMCLSFRIRPVKWSPFNWYRLILSPARISNHISSKVWDEIINPFPNLNGCTVEVWEWISNLIPHFIMDVITYPYKGSPGTIIVSDVTWGSWRLKSPAICTTAYAIYQSLKWCHNMPDGVSNHQPHSHLFTQHFIQAQIKENIKASRHWTLCGEFTCDRWIPRTKSQ